VTRAAPRKRVDAGFSTGRLRNARDFRKAAEEALVLAEDGQNAAPIVSNIVNAAIAYGDAITARLGGVVNAQDHQAAPHLLRELLKADLPRDLETRFRRILGEKDASQYRARQLPLAQARKRMQDLEKFADWAEDQLAL
jgi:hypothetical protein